MPNVELATTLAEFAQDISRRGFALWRKSVPDDQLEALRLACADVSSNNASSVRANQLYARRNLLNDVPAVYELSQSEPLLALVRRVLGDDFEVVRALLFDKVPEANWPVAWHQDLMIPLAERHDVAGFSSWSVKAGVVHAKPPLEVLQQMLTLRVHLDDCTSTNGPLRLLAGSHAQGDLSNSLAQITKPIEATYVCLASAGEVLAMRPLTLHASSPAERPAHRRVVHLEYARPCLPPPLRWATKMI